MKSRISRRLDRADAVVTGAASGIGRSLATLLAKRGADVICADINIDGATGVANAIKQSGGKAAAFACDVSQLGAVEALATFAEKRFGAPANFVVNNAGIGVGGSLIGDLSIDSWRSAVNVNLWGVIHGCHVFVPGLRSRGEGSLINIASAASFASAPRMAAYNVTKAGVLSLSETLAAELGDTAVQVSVACPTFVKTAIAENVNIDESARGMARRAMALTGRSPDRIAAAILDGHERGTFMILPQVEAKLIHFFKRQAPKTHLRLNALFARNLRSS